MEHYNKRNIKQLNNRHDKIRLLGLDKEMCFEKGFEGVQGRSITNMGGQDIPDGWCNDRECTITIASPGTWSWR